MWPHAAMLLLLLLLTSMDGVMAFLPKTRAQGFGPLSTPSRSSTSTPSLDFGDHAATAATTRSQSGALYCVVGRLNMPLPDLCAPAAFPDEPADRPSSPSAATPPATVSPPGVTRQSRPDPQGLASLWPSAALRTFPSGPSTSQTARPSSSPPSPLEPQPLEGPANPDPRPDFTQPMAQAAPALPPVAARWALLSSLTSRPSPTSPRALAELDLALSIEALEAASGIFTTTPTLGEATQQTPSPGQRPAPQTPFPPSVTKAEALPVQVPVRLPSSLPHLEQPKASALRYRGDLLPGPVRVHALEEVGNSTGRPGSVIDADAALT